MTRFFVNAYLDSFYTEDSGDISGEGEFYFKCNKKRYPDKGVIKLGKKETFDPEPNPSLFCAVLDGKEKQLEFDFEVWEEDLGKDDKFIDQKIKIPLRPLNDKLEIRGKKKSCILKLNLVVVETKTW